MTITDTLAFIATGALCRTSICSGHSAQQAKLVGLTFFG